MATVIVHDIDDAAYERLKRDAAANHRSLEAEARFRLLNDTGPTRRGTGLAEYFRTTMVDPGPEYEGSVALIRKIRDEE